MSCFYPTQPYLLISLLASYSATTDAAAHVHFGLSQYEPARYLGGSTGFATRLTAWRKAPLWPPIKGSLCCWGPWPHANFEANYYFTTTDQFDGMSSLRLGEASKSNDGFSMMLLKLEYSLK